MYLNSCIFQDKIKFGMTDVQYILGFLDLLAYNEKKKIILMLYNNHSSICAVVDLLWTSQMDSALTEVCTVNSRYHLYQQAPGHA